MLEHLQEYFLNLGPLGLAILAFVESSFFIIPPDVVLIPLSLQTPSNALFLALICTVFSTLGGAFGYGLGLYGGRPIFHKILKNKEDTLDKVEQLYNKYGVWAVLGAAFTPIPYKVFTIASGIFKLNFWGFCLASFIGRGGRFFIVATMIILFGEMFKKYSQLSILAITLIVAFFFFILWKKKHKFKS